LTRDSRGKSSAMEKKNESSMGHKNQHRCWDVQERSGKTRRIPACHRSRPDEKTGAKARRGRVRSQVLRYGERKNNRGTARGEDKKQSSNSSKKSGSFVQIKREGGKKRERVAEKNPTGKY